MSESSQDLSNKTNGDSVDNDEISSASSSAFPGRILRAAREELNYSLDQVAQELHLRPSVVLAMEEEKYDDFSSDVFLKGYFRSYCRLVNLHEERMVDLLESQLKGLQKDIEDAAHLIKKEKQVKKQKKAFIGLLLAALIVGIFSFLISLFYKGDDTAGLIEPSSESISEITVSTETKSQNNVLKKPVGIDNASLKATNVSTEKEINTIVAPNDIPTLDEKVGQIATSESEEKKPIANEQVEQIVSEPVAENMTNSLSLFEASFSGDCWFKLVDGNQKTVFAALKKDGDRISYTGVTPFKIVLGAASKAVLSFDGDVINLKSHTANNGRAQLTLNKG